nr:MAG TPA: hypothetical protein [Caudoviricetes sp.]
MLFFCMFGTLFHNIIIYIRLRRIVVACPLAKRSHQSDGGIKKWHLNEVI